MSRAARSPKALAGVSSDKPRAATIVKSAEQSKDVEGDDAEILNTRKVERRPQRDEVGKQRDEDFGGVVRRVARATIGNGPAAEGSAGTLRGRPTKIDGRDAVAAMSSA